MEGPIEKLHKLDTLTDAVYCHIRNYQFREECKQKQEATARHVEVSQQNEEVQQNRKRKFTPITLARQAMKAEEAIALKKERRAGVIVMSIWSESSLFSNYLTTKNGSF
jgi:CRISPR/Cas system-associated endonuclease Cas3-HD